MASVRSPLVVWLDNCIPLPGSESKGNSSLCCAITSFKYNWGGSQSEQFSYLDCFKSVDLRPTFCATIPAFCQPLPGHVLCRPYATYFFALSGESNSLEAAVFQSIGFFSARQTFSSPLSSTTCGWAVGTSSSGATSQ